MNDLKTPIPPVVDIETCRRQTDSVSLSKRHWICLGVLLAVIFIRFFKTIFLGKSISDIYLLAHWDSMFYPWRAGQNFATDPTPVQLLLPQLAFVSEYWHHAIPLWNQLSGFGVPLLADPEAFVFSPSFVLFGLFPSIQTWNATLILEMAICAVSTYFLCLQFEASVVAALTAALLFTFCPWVQYEIELFGNAICLVPLLCLGFVLIAKGNSPWYTVPAGIVAAAVVLSGSPELSFVSILFACLLSCLVALFKKHRAQPTVFAVARRIGLAGLIAFGISAPMLIPFAEYLLNGDTYKFSCAGTPYVSWPTIFALFIHPFGRWGSLFLGPISWLGVTMAVMRGVRKDDPSIHPLLICLMIALFSVVRSFPLSLLFAVPPFLHAHSLFWAPAYLLFLSLVSGIGIHVFMSDHIVADGRDLQLPPSHVATATIVAMTFLFLAPVISTLSRHNYFAIDLAFLQEGSRFVWKWWLVNAACLSTMIIARCVIVKRFPSQGRQFAVLAVAAGIAGLIAISIETRPPTPAFWYPSKLPITDAVRPGGRLLCIGNHLLRPMTNLIYKIPSATTWNPLYPKGFRNFITACGGICNDAYTQTFNANIGRLIDLAGVSRIVSTHPLLDEGAIDGGAKETCKRNSNVDQVLYSNRLVLNNIVLLHDSKAQTIFCRLIATPVTAGNYGLLFDVKDRHGNLVGSIEGQPIWNGILGQSVVCSGMLPAACGKCELSIRVIEGGSCSILLPTVSTSGKIRSDGSLLLGYSDDTGLLKEINNDRFKLLSSQESIVVYENKTALPRHFLVNRIKWVERREEALQYLKLHASEISKTAVLETSQKREFEDFLNKVDPKRNNVPSGTFECNGIISDQSTPNKFDTDSTSDLAFTSTGPSLMVVSDVYYPGWQAFVDGTPVPIFRADFLFRAILVPAGQHHIQFKYQPASFVAGVVLFSITIVALFIAFLWQMRRKFEKVGLGEFTN
jgi:hypothetical protein